MEERAAGEASAGGFWRDLGLLLVLLLLAGGVRAWVIGHTEVPARDGIGFIRFAWELQTRPWPEVLRSNLHPPGYPITVLTVSLPVCHFLGTTPQTMQLSAQL